MLSFSGSQRALICTAPFEWGEMSQIKHTHKFVTSHLGITSHIGTNAPKFVPLSGNDGRLTYLNRAAQIQVGLEITEIEQSQQNLPKVHEKDSEFGSVSMNGEIVL